MLLELPMPLWIHSTFSLHWLCPAPGLVEECSACRTPWLIGSDDLWQLFSFLCLLWYCICLINLSHERRNHMLKLCLLKWSTLYAWLTFMVPISVSCCTSSPGGILEGITRRCEFLAWNFPTHSHTISPLLHWYYNCRLENLGFSRNLSHFKYYTCMWSV